MAAYNVQSLFIFFGLVSLLGGLAASLFFHRLDASARYWTVAALLWGMTGIPTVFRDVLHPLWSYSIPIGLNSASFVLMGLGLARLYSHTPQLRRLVALAVGTVLFIVVMEWCRIHAGPKVTLLLSVLAFGVPSVLSIWPARQVYRLTGNPFAWHMQWVLGGLGLLHFVRLQAWIAPWRIETFTQDHWTLALWSLIFVFGLLRYVMYVAMRIQEQAQNLSQKALESARLQANRRLLEELSQHERQRSLGFISGAICHELNQPLTAIQGYAELAQHRVHTQMLNDSALSKCLEGIVSANQRASEMVRSIRQYASPASNTTERIGLRDTLNSACTLLYIEAQENGVTLQKPFNMPQAWLQADPLQLTLVWQNLMRNAITAMAHSTQRQLTITWMPEGSNGVLSFQDTGPGFPADAEKFVMMPFTNDRSPGWGVGLSVARHIIAGAGGKLWFHNLPGGGACVKVQLPLSDAPSHALDDPAPRAIK
jgi:signal transduction histidine kinase